MKKRIIVIMVLLICICTTITVNSEVSTPHLLNNNLVETDENFKLSFDTGDMDYYIFIYSKDDIWFNDNVIGPGDFEEGCLYSKNLKTGESRQLIEERISMFRDTENDIYFIYCNSIYRVDFLGTELTKVYSSDTSISEKILEIYENEIYYLENGNLVKLNLKDNEKTVLLENIDINRLYVKSSNELVLQNDDTVYYADLGSSRLVLIEDEADFNRLFVDEQLLTTTSTSATDPNLSPVDSAYPAGSYFSNSGSACTHHSSGCSYNGSCGCKQYSYCIQCTGFAKYACDKYAHLSSWNPQSGDQNDTQTSFSTDRAVYLYFAACSKGSYVRLTRSYSDDDGFHSIFFISVSTTSISTYECNLYGNCGISHVTRTLAAFRSFSPYSSYYVSHHYGGTKVSAGALGHKVYCQSSGCSGWKYEQHYSSNPGTNATCDGCGYVGNITLTSPAY